ncbi:MAG: DNA replication/repair protein RecF [Proteobacteria bacterium]|nr:DNA replication/repair protein RecF [Pseudomonadota bacterium]
MRLKNLRIENLRNIAMLDVALAPGINVFVGSNGAGKSSLLEAAYLLSHAQSFRAGSVDGLIRRGQARMAVAASVCKGSGERRLSVVREDGTWRARLDQANVPQLGTALREAATVCFEPGSHELIAGSGRERRRFLDWGVFHVEQDFLPAASRYRRVLRQRNMALKQGAADAELDAWDAELAGAALPVDGLRRGYFARFSPCLERMLALFLPELGAGSMEWDSGWPQQTDLHALLAQRRGLDRARGHTSRGPHRADWTLGFEHAPQRSHLSRGQEKLCALACVLAQARVHADACGDWPVIALDDLGSELDVEHQQRVLEWLHGNGEQALISGVEIPAPLRGENPPARVFHVEHGQLRPLL